MEAVSSIGDTMEVNLVASGMQEEDAFGVNENYNNVSFKFVFLIELQQVVLFELEFAEWIIVYGNVFLFFKVSQKFEAYK